MKTRERDTQSRRGKRASLADILMEVQNLRYFPRAAHDHEGLYMREKERERDRDGKHIIHRITSIKAKEASVSMSLSCSLSHKNENERVRDFG